MRAKQDTHLIPIILALHARPRERARQVLRVTARHKHASKLVAPELLPRVGPIFVLHFTEGFGGAVKEVSIHSGAETKAAARHKTEDVHFPILLARLVRLKVELVRLVVRLRYHLAEEEQAGVAA